MGADKVMPDVLPSAAGLYVVPQGPTPRDCFAALAMQAQIVAMGGLEGEDLQKIAAMAYEAADAMIAARSHR